MKLILTREVAGLGLAGDIVEVADGYGRNFLVPRGAAIAWTKGAEKQIVQIKRARDARQIRGVQTELLHPRLHPRRHKARAGGVCGHRQSAHRRLYAGDFARGFFG